MPVKSTCAVMSLTPTSASGSVSARWPRWHIERALVALRVVVLGLGKAVVDEEGGAPLEPLGERRRRRPRPAAWISVVLPAGKAAAFGGRVRRRPVGDRRTPLARAAADAALAPGRAVEMQQVDRHRVEHLVADDDAAHPLRQRVEPADAVAERAASPRAAARAAAPTARRSSSGGRASPSAASSSAASAPRAGAELPAPRRCRSRRAPRATWRASARPNSGDSSGAVTKSLPDLGHPADDRPAAGVVAEAGRVEGHRHEAAERDPAAGARRWPRRSARREGRRYTAVVLALRAPPHCRNRVSRPPIPPAVVAAARAASAASRRSRSPSSAKRLHRQVGRRSPTSR